MVRIKHKFIHIFSFLLLLCLIFATSAVVGAAASTREGELITTRNEFEKALNAAKDGDTLLVGDIDFNLQGEGAVNEAERITITKNITIKNGKTDGKAVFTGASFLLNGTNVAGKTSEFRFVGITFDEGLNADEITHTDWELSYSGDGSLISSTPIKCQRAINCIGNINANFSDCEFKNYMSVEGGAIYAWYLDGDNSHCALNLTLDGCSFESNSALNSGGAIYLRAKSNIQLSAVDCTFTDNRSGFNDQATGGGAVALHDCKSEFNNCEFKDNIANHFYGGDRFFDFGYVPEMGGNFILYDDTLEGGAILAWDGELSMKNCVLTKNSASYGGAIALQTITADIEDCLITENSAVSVLEEAHKNKYLGVGSCNGIGGAIYIDGAKDITISNTEIADNYADSAYGAIYATYVTYDPEFYEQFELNLLFCSIRDNACGVKISEIQNDSGSWLYDTHAIPYINTVGCLVLDEIYGEDIPKNEQPTEENGYNFFGSAAPAQWYNEEGHLVHAPTVSTDFIKEKLGDRNYYGTFTVGANNHEVTFKFFMDGVCKETVVLPSGVHPTRPAFEKVGYTLTAWTLTEDFEYQADRSFIVGNETGSVDFHAVFTPNVYKVTFDFGNAQTVEVQQTYDSPLAFPEVIERSGYTFGGWFTAEDGSGDKIEDGAIFTHAGDITYHAFYEKNFPLATVLIITFGVLFAGGLIALAFVVFKHKKEQPVAVVVEPVAVAEKELPDTSMLSAREREVLELLLEGKQRNEIAAKLYISENTVKKNISSIYSKLGVTSRNELFALFK